MHTILGCQCGKAFHPPVTTLASVVDSWWEGLMHQDGMGIPFICEACALGKHDECSGKQSCDCQHRIKENDND